MLSQHLFVEPFSRFFFKKTTPPEEKTPKRNLIADMFFNAQPFHIDRSFKAFVFGPGTFKAWAGTSQKMDELGDNVQSSVEKIVDDHSFEQAFCDIFPSVGIKLAATVEKIELEGKAIYSADNGALLISLDRQLSNDVLNAMIEQAPDIILCLD